MTRENYGTGVITKERSGRFRVRIPNGRGGYRSIGTRATEEEAERLRAAAFEESAGMCIVGVELFTYGEKVIERWAKAGQASVSDDRSRWAAVVARAPFVHAAVDCVLPADVRDFARTLPSLPATRSVVVDGKRERVELDRTLSWQSQKHALGLLSRVMNEAVGDGLISANPCKGVRLPRRQQRAEGWTWLTLPELAAVFALPLTREQRSVLTLAVYQGLRQGEIAALTWAHVDLDAGWLVIAASWDTATKSGRVRRIPLLEPAAEALKAWRPPSKRSGLVFARARCEQYARGYDWGWGDRRNGPDVPARAGIARRVRFHDLRHTCAAHLISGSWGRAWRLAEVREYLGHTEESVTARYSHLAPDALHATARATAATPVAKPPRDRVSELAAAAQKIREMQIAGGTGVEPVTCGSGDRGERSGANGLPLAAADPRQVIDGLLARAAAGEALAGLELAAVALDALRDFPAAEAVLDLLGAIGTPHAIRALARLSDALPVARERKDASA